MNAKITVNHTEIQGKATMQANSETLYFFPVISVEVALKGKPIKRVTISYCFKRETVTVTFIKNNNETHTICGSGKCVVFSQGNNLYGLVELDNEHDTIMNDLHNLLTLASL